MSWSPLNFTNAVHRNYRMKRRTLLFGLSIALLIACGPKKESATSGAPGGPVDLAAPLPWDPGVRIPRPARARCQFDRRADASHPDRYRTPQP